jgi:hypothetical protein
MAVTNRDRVSNDLGLMAARLGKEQGRNKSKRREDTGMKLD